MKRATSDHWLMRWFFIGIVCAFILFFLIFPVCVILIEALRGGIALYFSALSAPHSVSAIRLTLMVALAVVPMNTIFGVCAAWAVTHFKFAGKALLISLIEIPLWVSPVIGGLIYVLLYGRRGYLGPWLQAHDIRIIFALPGVVLATTFVTFPFVARSLIPLMQAQGFEEEEAALTLGASGFQILRHITLPKIRWGFFYGLILCNARAMGEFGAVSVVSAKISGKTNTMPLEIERLYNDYLFAAGFALASALALLALVTLCLKTLAEWENARQIAESQRSTLENTL